MSQLDTAAQYLAAVMDSADNMWTAWFKQVGLQEPMISYRIVRPGSTYVSKCTDPYGRSTVVNTDFPNAFFCALDVVSKNGRTYNGTIVLPLNTFLKMWDGNIFDKQSKRPGDFAAATIVAHEFGHHIANELQMQGAFRIPTTPPNAELEADCFSGVWARTVYKEGLLEPGDVEEAINALSVSGDLNVNSPDHHGTPKQRVSAWQIGYYGSKANPVPAAPGNCMVAFGGNVPV
ncbi:neutral zinc metallopeptidase [Dactylosporangium cerinum]|uniref:Neutral zinc metallopeptidase n=1 Tax=Dactylosporangium cerinum TaxID=1434730 RepID=A0ABV9WDB2_9ACTN